MSASGTMCRVSLSSLANIERVSGLQPQCLPWIVAETIRAQRNLPQGPFKFARGVLRSG